MFKFWKYLTRKIVSYGYDKMTKIMIIEYDNGDIEKYQGDCTVWYKLPDFRRAGTFKEAFLSDLQVRIYFESNN